jgi:hypothetical protein
MRKLSLVIDDSIAKKAEKYAQKKQKTLASIIENYLKTLADAEEHSSEKNITPLVQSLKGSFSVSEKTDYTKELTDSLTKKYL